MGGEKMLLADIHGKGMHETQSHEDYLTSTVFGHLRYLPPQIFWPQLFARAKGLSNELFDKVGFSPAGLDVTKYSHLMVHFWARHRHHGEPDLLLCFSGGTEKPLVVLIEAKYGSFKSGKGENDQLVKYLKILDDLPALRRGMPDEALGCLIYLTPRNSEDELRQSANQLGDQLASKQLLFRLQWQDIVRVAQETLPQFDGIHKLILEDVVRFLQRRALEYFDGFRTIPFPSMKADMGNFYQSDQASN